MEKQETHVAKKERTTGDESSPVWDELSQQMVIEALNLPLNLAGTFTEINSFSVHTLS